MAYQFDASTELDFTCYSETGGFAPLPKRHAVDPRGLKLHIAGWLETGLPVPEELLADLPYKIMVRRPGHAAYLGGFGCFLFDAAAYEVIRATGVKHWSRQASCVVDDNDEPHPKTWFMVAFPLIDRPRHFVDIAHSKKFVEEPAPYMPGGVEIGMTGPFGKLAFYKEAIEGLSIWRGAGGGVLSGMYFCSDAFRQAWEGAGMTGLSFNPVAETV